MLEGKWAVLSCAVSSEELGLSMPGEVVPTLPHGRP
jgi:hypothetical protein